MAFSSSSSSPCLSLSFPSSGNWDYDVFPSFHGADVRNNFLSHVLKEFSRKGIDLFIDNEIQRGEFIGPELKRAIRGSKIAVVLLSKNYASSSWCLDELVEIMKKKESGQIVIPIFYDVDPTNIRKQTKHFGKVFKKTCKGKDKEKIEIWRKALEGVATIAGYHSSVRVDEASMIEEIAAVISDMLNHSTPSRDFENFVGMEKHMEMLKPLLCLDLDERRMIGIWGPPGIGKTTIVRFLFSKLSNRFQNTAFMEDIKGTYPKICFDKYEAKLQLQKKMMSRMIDQSDIVVGHSGVVEQRLRNKKVLLVLDDVDRLAQLDALAGNVEWFGPGSRIIITTENRRLLEAIGINQIYEVGLPSIDEALEMFCMYAFKKKSPEEGFDELAREITYRVGELPLGLEVMGSHFRGLCKDKKQWSMEISRLRKTNLDGDIERILKFSFDALSDDYKDLFLHIACFFNREKLNIVEKYLAKRFKDLNQLLYVLEDKSLIYIIDDSIYFETYIEMHKLLVQLGKEIVMKESVREPWNRQFLNEYKDVCQILTHSTTITRSVFQGTFRVTYDSGHPIIIYWFLCPFTCLDCTNNLEFLVELHLSYSNLEKLWDGTKLLRNLKLLDLSGSEKLKELPNLSMATNLEKLNLKGCKSLMELHYSIRHATNLRELNLERCSSLVELPSSIWNATNLRKNLQGCSSLVELPSSIWNETNLELNLRRCSSLVRLPSFIGNATNLRELILEECSSLVELPASIGNATNLERLNLKGCSSLVELPASIGNATNLQELNLKECSSLVELPVSIGNATNLEKLNLEGCSNFVKLPASIGNATKLWEINLNGCSSLVKLPAYVWNATNFWEVNLEGCSSLVELPVSIGNVTNLRKLILKECSSLIELPTSIGNATNLEKLNLEGCSNLVKLPSSIGNATNLRELNLKGCSSLVELPSSICDVTNLRGINIQECSSLVELPASIGNATNLEELILQECSSLVELPASIGNATNLRELILQECSSLVELPASIGIATNLRKLRIQECPSLVELPASIGNATNLEELILQECSSLLELPASIGNATNLRELILQECSSLVELPASIGNATNLRKLRIQECPSLVDLPSSIGNATNLQKLDLKGCSSLVELPSSIGNATNLRELILQECSSLVELPASIGNAANLRVLNLEECSSLVQLPSSIKKATNLRELNLKGCSSLISLPQLPKFLSYLYAKNCKSLKKLDCSFSNGFWWLLLCCHFINCFNLNKEARDLIIQTSTREGVVLPGKEVPACFTYRASRSCVTVKLNEKHLPTSTKFKACILVNKNSYTRVSVIITSEHKNGITTHRQYSKYLNFISEHLHIFDFEAEVTSTELDFTFELDYRPYDIKECGVLPILGASC